MQGLDMISTFIDHFVEKNEVTFPVFGASPFL